VLTSVHTNMLVLLIKTGKRALSTSTLVVPKVAIQRAMAVKKQTSPIAFMTIALIAAFAAANRVDQKPIRR